MSPETRRKLLGFLGALPAAFWCVLAATLAFVFALLRGKALGRADAAREAADAEGRERIGKMQDAAARGDDAEAQRAAFEGIRPRMRGRK